MSSGLENERMQLREGQDLWPKNEKKKQEKKESELQVRKGKKTA